MLVDFIFATVDYIPPEAWTVVLWLGIILGFLSGFFPKKEKSR